MVVPFDKISNHFVNALLVREDTRFYYHHGIDPIGIARAIVRNFVAGGFREGASTLTQQLARNSFPLGGKNVLRKMIEAALAYRIETELTKEEILEAYMNRIYFGSGYYGVETASQAYFGKPASLMNLPEAAMLAGLIRSPNRFSPFNNLKKAIRERNSVLARMRKLDFITENQMVAAIASTPRIAPKRRASPQDNWAMDSILRELELVIDRDQFDNGGLKITRRSTPHCRVSPKEAFGVGWSKSNRCPVFHTSPSRPIRRTTSKVRMPCRIWRAQRLRSTAIPEAFGPLPEAGTTTAASSTAPCWPAGRSALR